MIYYVLNNRHSQTLGIFTTPEKAMEFAYLSDVYQQYRGYKSEMTSLVWQNDSNYNWYARLPEDAAKPPFERGVAILEIHVADVDRMPPVADELRGFAILKQFPTLDELYRVENNWRS